MFVLPSIRRRRSAGARRPWRRTAPRSCRASCEPHDVFTPAVQKMSLCAIGMPVSGVASPFASRWSAASLCASACSAVTVTNAFSVASSAPRARGSASSARPPTTGAREVGGQLCQSSLCMRQCSIGSKPAGRAAPRAARGRVLFDDLRNEIQVTLDLPRRCAGRARDYPSR